MSQNPVSQRSDTEAENRPAVTDHPEQRRQEQTGQEDASDASEIGRPPSQSRDPKKNEHAA